MGGNTFGQIFRVTTWGESHGPALGAVIDGCPPKLPLAAADIEAELSRRRPGASAFTSSRKEPDRVEILSGVFEGQTSGTPISLIIYNRDVRSEPYEPLRQVFRPGHGDFTYWRKYGIRDHRGGGRSSARETVARVAAGAVAQKILDQEGIQVLAFTLELGGIRAQNFALEQIWDNPFFCPDATIIEAMAARVQAVRDQGDSLGGLVEVRVQGCPAGLGEPVFDKLDAALAQAVMSVGAVKGVEIGAGFAAARLLGSEHNDPLTPSGFASNNAGGILAGISNGDEIILRAAVKPIPSIAQPQQTIDLHGQSQTISITGRHDISAIPRIVPVIAAMVRLTLADFLLRQRTII
ncbi:MAG: chorismate synthase [Deltaproteobacteria bacterium]|nr:chorismate synthase [Deltaproteobacteria bacterium]MBW1952444.1 chorismate synthase [Deltaproteobacteria bacterium]MBW1986688.1 chorismate synthase [Deltaproteobacteria bacterium]MBW2134895.1 chorismate synthase [Deltaproteobacteria bacterium]